MPASTSISRRQLLQGAPRPEPFRPRPPGVNPSTLKACISCGDCVSACPDKLLALAEDGVVLVPERGECTFCGLCAEVCEASVFAEALHMSHVVAISDDCLVRAGITCMACRDTCPAEAIFMRPRVGGPFLPVLDQARCCGCGACVAPCPANAIHAVKKELDDA